MASNSKKLIRKRAFPRWLMVVISAVVLLFLAAHIAFKQVVKQVFTEQNRQALNRGLSDVNLQVVWSGAASNLRFQVEIPDLELYDARNQQRILGPAEARLDVGPANAWRMLTGKDATMQVQVSSPSQNWRIQGHIELRLQDLLERQGKTQLVIKWQALPLEVIKVALVDDFVKEHEQLRHVSFRGQWTGNALFILDGYQISQGKAELSLQKLWARLPRIADRELSFADADVSLQFENDRWAFVRPLILHVTESDITLTIKKDLASDELDFTHRMSLPSRRP
ncbi:MAG: hypothetical protein ACOH5I_01010 [Oligoflexus sp.]